jgi:hypothetical protein
MPAVELSRLSTQIRLVSQHFASANDFVKQLNELYEFYSDRTFNKSDASSRNLTLPAYNVTPLINHQCELAFGKLCQENPLSSLDVIDALWQQPRLEPRRLAAFLLGKIPLEYADQVIQRLKAWSKPEEDHELIKYLQNNGSLLLRKQHTQEWLDVIRFWLQSEDSQDQIFGLQSLLPFIDDPDFSNLPRVFDLIILQIQNLHPRVTYTLETVIEALAARTPSETVYILKSTLVKTNSKDLARLIRRMIPIFPEEQQKSLKLALNEMQK